MGKTLQEQLRELNALFVTDEPTPEAPEPPMPQMRRWVVWRKDGKDYRKVCVMDTDGTAVGRVVML